MFVGGYTLQAMGLELTTASRGAFTGTFTVLAVPILVGLSGRKIPWSTWAAAAGALTGAHWNPGVHVVMLFGFTAGLLIVT